MTFDEAFATVPADWQDAVMTRSERNHLRSLVTEHAAWPDYRREWSVNAADLDRRRVLHFCAVNGIDWRAALRDLPPPAKPRPVPRKGRAPKCPHLSDDPITQRIGEALWPQLYLALRDALSA